VGSTKAYNVQGTIGEQQIVLKVEPPSTGMFSPSLYAPALPGVLVALFGLYVGHVLARSRDRRKEISDLCDSLKAVCDDAADAAVEAWLLESGPDRDLKIQQTKRKLQSVGIAATTLKRRAESTPWRLMRLLGQPTRTIDVLSNVAHLRRTATSDPFEDPSRKSDAGRAGAVTSAAAGLESAIDYGFTGLYRS
jgi:hypothetical protein